MISKEIHPDFRLNGVSYGFDELKEVAYSLIKEGKDHEKHIGDFLTDWLDDKNEVAVQTSGSTGTPKTILIKKEHMVNSARATGAFFDLQPQNTALLCLSAEYIAGKMMLVRAMILGLELDYVPPVSNSLEQVQKQYDFCAMVPLQLQNSLDNIERIDKLIIGGAPMSTLLKSQVQGKSTKVYETYGMTETITHVAIRDVRLSAVEAQVNMSEEYMNGGFKALPNVTFSRDHRDCLVIIAPKVSKETVITNDIVNLISNFEFQWLGRFDNVINSGGVKLFPEQLEAKLEPYITHPFFVAGLPDEKFGQRLVLIVEGEIDSESMLGHIKKNVTLGKFEVPKAIFQLPQFVRTDTGKIRRTETLELLNS